MPNTYTQLLVQMVFAVKNRNAMINDNIRIPVEEYISGIIRNKDHKLLAQYYMPDHCHILIGLNPNESISNLVKDIKSNSSRWLNEQRIIPYKFNWQEGYGAFSYSKSQIDSVVKYVLNQTQHHKKRSFKEEYHNFLQKFDVVYKSEFLFEWL